MTVVCNLDLELDIIIGLCYTNVPNFGSLSCFWRCKEHPCSLSPDFGPWQGLEVPDWGLASWSWLGYGHWSLIHLHSKFWLSILILKFHVPKVLIWGFGGCWRFLIGICNLDIWLNMDFWFSLNFPKSFSLVAQPRAEKLVSPGLVWSGLGLIGSGRVSDQF